MEDTFKIGTKCTVECAGIDIPFEVFINEINNDNIVYVVSSSAKNLPVMNAGTEIKVKVRISEKLIVYHGTVFKSNQREWGIANLSEWDGWERRENYRQKVCIEAQLREIAEDNIMLNRNNKINCTILDISAGGLKISCPSKEFKVGDLIALDDVLLMEKTNTFSFYCEILRTEKTHISNFYGCRFFGMSEREQEKLISVVFRLQQLEYRKKKLR